ncbi:MAG: VWA domain-containing protein [Clostridia bacterium]|nr:VWA domain-containing protein [Clostridia bacterium]
MSWLTPLGFLGFIGLIILLIIYIIKPNYQNKYISSTFVWKLSLKYRKKRMPLSKLRNIILIICQVLIVTACAFILAQPYIDGEDENAAKEKVLIIDASASMFSELEGETRFERAVAQVEATATEVMSEGSVVTVILAGREASLICQRADATLQDTVTAQLAELVTPGDLKCTWGNADIEGAMRLAEDVIEENPKAEVVLYTGTKYIDDGKVVVHDVSDISEWNAAILDVRAVVDENYYRFEVDTATYGRVNSVKLYLEIHGAYGVYGTGESSETVNGGTLKLEYDALLNLNERGTIRFGSDETDDISDLKIFAYDHVYCYVQEDDALEIDNSFYLYGGTPLPLKVQYYSTKINNFVSGALMGLRNHFKDDWDIEIDEIHDDEKMIQMGLGKEPELSGYDIYIFEHHMPKTLPTDGLVILINPDTLPKGTDFVLGNQLGFTGEKNLNADGVSHEIMTGIDADNITVTRYRKINAYDSGYTPLLYVEGDPVVIAKNDTESKVVLFSFSMHYSNIALTPEFPVLMSNIIKHYIPSTFESPVVDLYDTVTLNSRSPELSVQGPAGLDETFTEFPATIAADAPGFYTVTQTPISGLPVVEKFYVTIPDNESNIVREEDSLTKPYYPPVLEDANLDLVFYFALALVALMFVEWWLKSRETN